VTDEDKLLTINEAAEFLRTPVATLRWWRSKGIGPRSFKIGRRVFYWLSDLTAWLDEQRQEQPQDHRRQDHVVRAQG
jgi:predicted DNA-binding transcriptional regulator AlpA